MKNVLHLLNFHLRVTIDNKLSWHEHIGIICNQISKGVDILNRLNMSFARNSF